MAKKRFRRVRAVRTRYVKASKRIHRTPVGQAKTLIRPFATGIGAGILGEMIAEKVPISVVSQNKTIVGIGGAFLMGGWKGALGMIAIDAYLGKLGNIPFLNQSSNASVSSGDGW